MRAHSILMLTSLLVACGKDQDATTEHDDSPGKSSLDSDGETDADENNEADTGDYGALSDIDGEPFEPDSVEAFFYAEDDPVWVLTAKEGDTWLYIENYPRFGGATGAESRTLGDSEVDYASCGVCVLLKTGCSVHGDHAHCSTSYMPEAGSRITFEELGSGAGDDWSGSLSPVRFVEVSIDSSTFATTPVEGGDQIELDAWAFDVTLEEG